MSSWYGYTFRIIGRFVVNTPLDSPQKGPAMQNFDPQFPGGFPSQRANNAGLWCFGVSVLAKYWTNSRWFETPWRSCDATVIRVHMHGLMNRRRLHSKKHYEHLTRVLTYNAQWMWCQSIIIQRRLNKGVRFTLLLECERKRGSCIPLVWAILWYCNTLPLLPDDVVLSTSDTSCNLSTSQEVHSHGGYQIAIGVLTAMCVCLILALVVMYRKFSYRRDYAPLLADDETSASVSVPAMMYTKNIITRYDGPAKWQDCPTHCDTNINEGILKWMCNLLTASREWWVFLLNKMDENFV